MCAPPGAIADVVSRSLIVLQGVTTSDSRTHTPASERLAPSFEVESQDRGGQTTWAIGGRLLRASVEVVMFATASCLAAVRRAVCQPGIGSQGEALILASASVRAVFLSRVFRGGADDWLARGGWDATGCGSRLSDSCRAKTA